MPSVLIQLDDSTFNALNEVAPTAKRSRAEFIRKAIKEAIRREECERIREGYRAQPDSASDADDWANAEEFNP